MISPEKTRESWGDVEGLEPTAFVYKKFIFVP
jgi:hypothetical protein